MAQLPRPAAGLVIRYSYLWADEHEDGAEDGSKDRPCAIVLTTSTVKSVTTVVVLPITHSQPVTSDLAVEIPLAVKQRLGLDGERSWVVISEANHFLWPGVDLRPIRQGDVVSFAYGELPANLFRRIRDDFAKAYRLKKSRLVPRTE